MINSNLYTHYIQEFIFKDEKFINESNFNYPQSKFINYKYLGKKVHFY